MYELQKDRILRLGSCIPLDGRISWAPHRPGRYQPVNVYMLKEQEQTFVIDTGLPSHRETVVEQVSQYLPRDLPLYVVLTRQEMVCAGNLAAINAVKAIKEVVATPGGGNNPFNAFDKAVSATATIRQTSMDPDSVVPIPPSPSLQTVSPLIRVNVTAWLYDRDSKTLFTSDLFAHGSLASPSEHPVLTDCNDDTSFEDVRDAMLMKFFWLRDADKRHCQRWLETVFNAFEIKNIAPTTGPVLQGDGVVSRHYDLVQQVLSLGH